MATVLEPGARLAHYVVAGRLGAGGMGEVYKAQDTVLGRAVALKVLPSHVVRNDERMRRFVQEARSASSLNHPHIVTIYEVGQAAVTPPGADAPVEAAPIHYIAMELVEGVTLRTKIHDERVGLRTLLGYMAQAAEGLAKAHATGIVHRDLKPDNIMVTADGFAKVLDFGLAKLTPPSDGTDPTRTAGSADTADGMILGTVAYMSPEQVQGRAADHRSDIFAAGAILYEAATGQRPFSADSDVEVMHKILHDKPQPVADLNPAVPAELRRTIRRCLAKEPERRFQSMKDLAIELAEIVEEYDQLSVSTASGSRTTSPVLGAPPMGSLSRRAKALMVVATLLVIAGAVFTGYQYRKGDDQAAGPVAFEAMDIRRLTTVGTVSSIALSPDGRYVAYTTRSGGRSTAYIHQVATSSDVRIIPEQAAPLTSLTFSPDGNYLYYASTDELRGNIGYSWLYAVPSLGGPPRKIAYDIDTPLAFSPDGTRIAFGRGAPAERQNLVIVMNADGTGERTLTGFPRYFNASKPAWSPDGRKIVTSTIEMSPAWTAVLMEIDVESGEVRRLGNTRRFEISDLHFLADGSALLMTAADTESGRRQIWMQPYPDGAPVRVTNDLGAYRIIWPTGDGSVMAAIRQEEEVSFALAEVGDTAHGSVFLGGLEQIDGGDVSVSSTGTVVFSNVTRGSSTVAADIMASDTSGATPRALTRGGENFSPVISRDGRTIVYSAESTTSPPRLVAIDADGSNQRQLTDGGGETDPSISADGRVLTYLTSNGADLWVRPTAGGEARKLSDRNGGPKPGISPDGTQVFFTEWTGAALEALHLKVVPAAGGAPVLDRPIDRADDLQWHPRGDTVTFRRTDGGVTNVFGITVATGTIRALTRFERGAFDAYDWVDDDTLVVMSRRSRADAVLISNWRTRR